MLKLIPVLQNLLDDKSVFIKMLKILSSKTLHLEKDQKKFMIYVFKFDFKSN